MLSAKLLVSERGKGTKAESGGIVTNQPPRGAISTKQRSREAQILRAGEER
jgi:hypothetical protein